MTWEYRTTGPPHHGGLSTLYLHNTGQRGNGARGLNGSGYSVFIAPRKLGIVKEVFFLLHQLVIVMMRGIDYRA